MSVNPAVALAMADAVKEGDLAAALGLADWLREGGGEGKEPQRLYVYDNGGSYSDHCIDFITAPASLPEEDVRRVILMGSPDSSIVLTALAWEGGGTEPLCEWLMRHQHSLEDAWDSLEVPQAIAAGLLPLVERRLEEAGRHRRNQYHERLERLLAGVRARAGLTPATTPAKEKA
jgi:hypothetical protein